MNTGFVIGGKKKARCFRSAHIFICAAGQTAQGAQVINQHCSSRFAILSSYHNSISCAIQPPNK